MQKWEYLWVWFNEPNEHQNSPQEQMNRLGEEGWEMIAWVSKHGGHSSDHYVMKRPKQEEAS